MSVATPGRSRGRNRTRVLVVSSDASARTEISRALGAQDLDVTAVEDAFAALAALARLNGSAPATGVAIVDTHLPGLSGWDLLRHLRIWLPETPLLRLEVAGTDVPLEGARLGIAVMAKPVRPPDLLLAVRTLLATPRTGPQRKATMQ
jgi:DNA-binding response OmpR family regulator